mgnify:CR=1 FL=1
MPISVIRDDPFYLDWGSSVYVIVVATNIVGDSLPSSEGNGAVIVTVPDAPINVENVPAITSGNQIGLTWSPGLVEGGSPLIDYRISYDSGLGTDVYTELVSGLTTTTHTVTSLTRGVTYKFKL